MILQKVSLETIVEKLDKAGNQYWLYPKFVKEIIERAFFTFPTMFSTDLKNFLLFLSNVKLSSANSFSLAESKICCLGKG